MKFLVGCLFAVVSVAVLGAVMADTPAPELTIEDGRHFRHDAHKAPLQTIGIDVDNAKQCQTCHSLGDKGEVLAPAAQGHAPCLRSGCHADDFMAISQTRKKSKPQEFRKSATMCLGCHTEVPWPWKKQKTQVIQAWRNQREHHIEMAKKGDPPRGMDHYDHMTNPAIVKPDKKRLACRDCHVVDDAFKLATGTPGHQQCMTCHGKNAFPMNECGNCHKEGGREEWMKGVLAQAGLKIDPAKGVDSRPQNSVRACESSGSDKLNKTLKKKTTCFKHETSGHRLANDKTEIQCSQCHWMIGDEKAWNGKRYGAIADLHVNRIIGAGPGEVSTVPAGCGNDKNDAQHAACSGGKACHEHAKEVNLSCPLGVRNCVKCHAERTNNEAF